MTERQIAVKVGVSCIQVHRDLKAIEAEWRANSQAAIEDQKAQSLATLERIISEAWKTIKPVVCDKEISEYPAPALDTIIRAEERRAKLFGLDSPDKMDLRVGPLVFRVIDDDSYKSGDRDFDSPSSPHAETGGDHCGSGQAQDRSGRATGGKNGGSGDTRGEKAS
jgi:hypothetical protein